MLTGKESLVETLYSQTNNSKSVSIFRGQVFYPYRSNCSGPHGCQFATIKYSQGFPCVSVV